MSASSADVPSRAVLDTNLFVSGALRAEGNPNRILQAWRRGEFVVVSSAPLSLEVADVLQRPELVRRFRLSPQELGDLIEAVLAVEHVNPLSSLPIRSRDPTDDKLLACALDGRADYLVTGDPDLLVLADEPALGELRIIGPAAFLEILGRQGRGSSTGQGSTS